MSPASAPATTSTAQSEAVLAAGALVWKMVDGKARVLLSPTAHREAETAKAHRG